MANVELHAMFNKVRGKVGDFVFKKRGDTLYISSRPDFRKRKLSAAQKRSVARFREAVKHAQNVLSDPQERKPFEKAAKKNRKTAYNTIIAAYLAEQK